MNLHLSFFLPFLAILLLSAANGANDNAKGIATLVGSRLTSPIRALVFGSLATFLGSSLSAYLAKDLLGMFVVGLSENGASLSQEALLSVALAAFTWVGIASLLRLPVSTTHAITGGLIGASVVSFSWRATAWERLLDKFLFPLLVSPFLALLLMAALFPLLRRALTRRQGTCVCIEAAEIVPSPALEGTALRHAEGTTPAKLVVPVARIAPDSECADGTPFLRTVAVRLGPDALHWISAGLASFGRGLNDTPKVVALACAAVLGPGITGSGGSALLFLGTAVAMFLGGVLGGRRVLQALSVTVARMDPLPALAGNLVTAMLVVSATRAGLPVSTTHVSTGAIVGAGLATGTNAVRWRVVSEFVLAWLITLPFSALAAVAIHGMLP